MCNDLWYFRSNACSVNRISATQSNATLPEWSESCRSLSALQHVTIVVNHFAPGATIDYGLLSFPTCSLFSFVRYDGDRTKFYSLNRTPGPFVAFCELHAAARA